MIDDNPMNLLREDLRDFAGYSSARSEKRSGRVWLNANEAAWPSVADGEGAVRRYPDPQPQRLRECLAELYGCAPEQLLAGRGSDEAIDLLVRGFCRPGGDAIVITPPTFGMYAVNARLHGTRIVEAPLRDTAEGFACDFAAIADAAEREAAKLVFLCSPGNPSGTLLPLDEIEALALRLRGRAMVVVDEAYIEFADGASAVSLLARQRNIAVLRTLSKAHALAAARIGSVIADAGVIAALQRCQAPYPLPTPCVNLALRALAEVPRNTTKARIATAMSEREKLLQALWAMPGVRRVYPSQANFLLARFDDPQAAFDGLLDAGVVVRDFRHAPQLGDALRISLGTPEQNAAVIEVLNRVARTSCGAAA
ncbi:MULTISPECIES: histidinol-phosphate transaminase [unclassified Lysobacter]|uniref:histidinol-phosphate transaminase n=1 Tax=unclassified Lysobacter TaxID=2635362 RepID=UPI001BE79F3F|nr:MULTISPECIES: histidinol-phosphate transaminase [unclassified Lysobacter]MBT2746542.1 histidinol-phosphate transaminase [Lysobacter sp. ISL-42]MBT2753995.1 histidinol-phosphate transaminase [Lysobacter sp. ISL-50]MBT2778931.1 histidinol-phosphate transaminase [Lysobacter sp. ISL-54]MBT2782492.1 histidinol-phosphate transaminase [Lysobacter sp. ISL-52]